MLGVSMRISSSFFDRPAVTRAMDRASHAALSKAGAFVRQRAFTSMAYSGKTSEPGEPPLAHTGDLRKIFFAYDHSSRSVVVGPLRFKGSNVPNILEYGGVTHMRRGNRRRTVRIAPRPYMRPALAAEAPGFDDMWKNSIKATT